MILVAGVCVCVHVCNQPSPHPIPLGFAPFLCGSVVAVLQGQSRMIWFVTRSCLIAGAQHVLFCFVFVLKGQEL